MTSRRDTRAATIETAYGLIRRRGYHDTSLGDIAIEGNIPKGSIHFHFPGGKEELGVEVVRQGDERVRDLIDGFAAEADSAGVIERLFAAGATGLQTSDFGAGCAIGAVALDAVPGSARLGFACMDAFTEWQAAFRALLVRDGVAVGRAEDLAGLVVAAFEGGLMLARVQRSTRPMERAARELGELVRAAASATKPTPVPRKKV